MSVYIEYVILDNLLIDLLIIYLTSSLLKLHFNKINMLLSALIGTAFAVVMPFISLNSYILFFLKLAIGMVMVLVLKKFSFGKFVLTFIAFVSITFMMGGMCFGLMYLLNIQFTINGIMIYGFEFPISLLLLCFFGYLYLATKIISVVRNERKINKTTYKIIVTYHDKEYQLTGFLDTGNMVYDNGKPVIILGYRSFKKIFKNSELHSSLIKKFSVQDLEQAHYICLSSANDSDQMLVFNIPKLEITGKKQSTVYNDVHAGLSYKTFNNFDCILHPDFF